MNGFFYIIIMGKKHGRKINYTIEHGQITLSVGDVSCSIQTYPLFAEEPKNVHLVVYSKNKNGSYDRFTLVTNFGLAQVVRFEYQNKFQTDVRIPPNTNVQEMKEIYIPKISALIEYYKGLEQLEHL